MTGNDGMNGTSKDISPARVRALLEGRTPGEWKVYKYWNGRLDVHSPTGEDDTCTSVITFPTAVDAELFALAPELATDYLDSHELIEVLTLERDHLAHELRLLREAVAENRIAVEWERLQVWLGSQDVPSQIHMRGNELVVTIRDVMASSPEQRELREAQAAVERAQKRVEAERRMVQVAADTQWAELDLAAAETALAHAQSSLAMLQAASLSDDTLERSEGEA